MYILGKLVFQSYIPSEFEKGMLFLRKVSMMKLRTLIEYNEVFELKEIPRDIESFVSINGWPVAPFIFSITANPDSFAEPLAAPDQMGWWDDGPDSEDLRDIDIKDYNYILEEDGYIEIEVDAFMNEDGEEIVTPILYMDKVTVRIPTDEEEYDEEYEEYDDEEDDWDDMDDEPEDDDTMNGHNREGGISFNNDSTWQGR